MNTIRFSETPLRGEPVFPGRARALRGAARLLLALALAGSAAACSKQTAERGASSSAPAGRGEVGTMAPEFTLPDLQGNQVASSSLKGKVVILDFWATWCPPCKEGIPHFVNLQSKYRSQGLEVVGLSLDAGGAKDVRPFVEENDVNFTMLIANDDVAKAYGNITMIPTTFVLDRSGKIVQRFVGLTSPEVFEQTIRPLLAAS